MKPPRWKAISPSEYEWEREALDFLREHLPDYEPYRAWSNLEFIDDEGRVNEVDALVLTPAGLILVEIKSRPGTLQGDPHTWTWTTDGRQISDDNPLLLANRKAKRLASVLRRQDAFGRGKVRAPWVEAVIFLSGVRAEPRLDPGSAQKVFRRGDSSSPSDRGIIGALTGISGAGLGRRGSVDANGARATQRAVEQAGIRPRLRSRRVGDYELGAQLGEGEGWQDFLAKHVSLGVARRVRIYPFTRAASPEERKRLGRMATREFRVLEGIDHPGILRVLHFEESELGPALVFEHDPAAMRLDQFLAQHLQDLTLDARLDLLRELAVGLGYAHGKRLYHQGLTPQNILVRGSASDRPRVQIMNWQVAIRGEGNTGTSAVTMGTGNLDDHFADPAKVYLAPESLGAHTESGPRADVFSLGAIAYHLFTGKPPADNPLDLPEKLRTGDGLRLSEAIDGVGAGLEDLVRMSTAPNVAQRIGSAPEFLEYMALAEAENRPVSLAPANVDPSVAQCDDPLDGGLVVERRLGRGSTADVLLVRREADGQRLVLKVAIDEIHGDRLYAEAELIASLHHQNIVHVVDTIKVSGRNGMLMEWAGEQTLASLIRSPTPLSLDLVRRYGDELLQAVDYLEQKGVAHRDIKPDNIGVGAVGGNGRKRLVLFDFSLARTPPENIQAGTRPYLDPFLSVRHPPRWDLHAERYAVAVTLNEMLTGEPPVWGDGLSDPAATDDEARIGAERFEPTLRDGLVAFFRRAFSRAPEERFGNAEDMLRAWRQAFALLDQRPIGQDDLEVIARQLDRRSPIAELGFSVEARDVLLRMHIHTIQQLLAVDRIRFRYLRNVGDKIRREIRLRAKHLAEYRPDLQADGGDTPVSGRPSLDRVGELLLPRRPAGDETSEDRALANYLGIEGVIVWPTPGDVAKACEIPRSVVATALEQGRDRWHRAHELNELRTDIAALLQGAGGVATVDELAGQLLAARGSVEEDEGDRGRLARAALRAAVELEASVEPIRFGANAEGEPVLLATHPDLADHARRLGQAADRLAASDPLPSLNRAQEELAAVPASTAVTPPPTQRVLRLAVSASRTAALSARLEIYPRGLAPLAALRLSLGSLVGAQRLTETEVRERVRGRFPDATPLPDRPDLDALLEEAGAERLWRPDEKGGAYYAKDDATDSSTPSVVRHGTIGPLVDATPEVLSARDLEEKLAHATKTGAFLALTVEPRRAGRAEAELLRRFPRQRVSLEHLLLQALRGEAATRRANWSVVLAADAAQPDTKDFKRLLSLAARAAEGVRRGLLALAEPALLVNPGLLARYDLMPILTDLAQASGTRGGPPGLWLLIPQLDEGMPRIDGAALPVISSANWAHLTDPWLTNAHRAGARPAA